MLGKRPEWLHAGVVFGLLLFGLAYLQFDWMGAEFSAGILHGANEDWDWQLTMYEVTRLGVVDWGQLPVWNPFTQGGVPLLANPEFPLFYPPFALVLALGTEAGIKLGILFHYGLLILGCWVAGREMGLSRLSAHLGAAFLVFSAFLPGFVAYGHIMFLPLGWLPLAWVAARRGRWAWSAAALSLAFLAGGHYLLLYGALWIGLDALFRAVRGAGLRIWCVLLALNGVALGAFWLKWPILLGLVGAVLLLRPRRHLAARVAELSAIGVLAALILGVKLATAPALFERAERLEAQNSVQIADACPESGDFDPSTCYSGPGKALSVMSGRAERLSGHEGQNVFGSAAPVLLGFLGLTMAAWFAPSWGLIGLVFWCLGWGGATPLNLVQGLHSLPGFDHLRVVERYSLIWTLFLGWGAGFLTDWIWRRLRWGGLGVLLLAAWLWLPSAHQEARLAMALGPQRARPAPLEPAPFRQLVGPHSNFEALIAGQGKLDCWTTAWLENPAAGLRALGQDGYRGEAWMAETGESIDLRVTTASLEVVLPYGGEVVINQNSFRGWSVDGHPITAESGLLRANLSSGLHVFRYTPPGLMLGSGLSLVGLILLFGFARQKGFYRRASGDGLRP